MFNWKTEAYDIIRAKTTEMDFEENSVKIETCPTDLNCFHCVKLIVLWRRRLILNEYAGFTYTDVFAVPQRMVVERRANSILFYY